MKMMKLNSKKRKISLGEKILLLCTTEKLTTNDICHRLYGNTSYAVKRRVIVTIGRLRKRGIDLYPDSDGFWTLPKSNKELIEYSQHKIKKHSTGSFRMIKANLIAENNVKELKGSTQKLLDSITNIDDDELKLYTPEQIKKGQESAA